MKKLLLFPGGGDPNNSSLYKKVFGLIESEATKRGYSELNIISWPGHFSYDNHSFLNFESSVDVAVRAIKNAEETSSEYAILARSYGTGVFLEAMRRTDVRLLKFASLWGMPGYWVAYELFKERINKIITVAKEKGIRIDKSFISGLIPNEFLLKEIQPSYPLNIVVGDQDKYCPKYQFDFYVELNTNSNIHYHFLKSSKEVKLIHEVTQYHKEYIQALFNEL